MALYESVFIIHPSTSDDDVNAIIERVREIIAKTGGNVVHVETWGRKKLAYEVKKQRKGNYVLLNYEGGSGVVQELERNFRLMDSVLKFMTIKVDPRIGLPRPQPPSAEGGAAPPGGAEEVAPSPEAAPPGGAEEVAPSPEAAPPGGAARGEAEKGEKRGQL